LAKDDHAVFFKAFLGCCPFLLDAISDPSDQFIARETNGLLSWIPSTFPVPVASLASQRQVLKIGGFTSLTERNDMVNLPKFVIFGARQEIETTILATNFARSPTLAVLSDHLLVA